MAENALGGLSSAKAGWGAKLPAASAAPAPSTPVPSASPRKATPAKDTTPSVSKQASHHNRESLHREDRSRKHADGQHSKPTKASLQDRRGSPSGAGYVTSGIDAAMQRLADKQHKPVFKGRKR